MGRRRRNYKPRKKSVRKPEPRRLSAVSRAILTRLFKNGNQLSKQKLVKQLKTNEFSSAEVEDEISYLLTEKLLVSSGKSKLAVAPRTRMYRAVLEMTRSGFGFAVDLTSANGKPVSGNDLFIHRKSVLSAHHGDTILVLVVPGLSGKKPEGRVLAVLDRKAENVVGFAVHERSELIVYPEDPRFPFIINIHPLPDPSNMPAPGDAVIVKLDNRDTSDRTTSGTIIENLGNPDRIEVLTRMTVAKHQLPYQFSPEAQAEADQASIAGMLSNREDLREILHVTIDGADAKDFDDAVAVEKKRHGYRLYVSIADVSAFVHPGSRIDREAYDRGTSVYFPGAVIPMLPENLSNNLCSLVPEEDRLTITAILDFDRDGVLLEKHFVRSVIRSHMRFTYDTVRQIVVDKAPDIRRSYKPFLTPLKWAVELAEALLEQRRKRGSVILNLAEADIRIENGDTVASITKRSRNFAHQVIEEFMLAANEAVAHTFAEHGAAALYRIHEEPDTGKVSEFINISRILGLDIPGTSATQSWFCSLVEQVRDTDREFIVNSLLLRTMQQARYSHANSGHFGLGATHYTHFTSPIRRYPDLIVHRLLCQFMESERAKPKQSAAQPYKNLQEAGLHLSGRERAAVTAERDMMDKLKCKYMQGRVGDQFSGLITSVSDSLIFVELIDHLISGAILLSDLTDDYYLYDHKQQRLIGDITCKIYQVGDFLTVQASDVDISRNKIFFTVAAK